ncbi:HNH endonuclease [Psychrobacter celer]|uniref:HNH endonuclease n=1 Tax=Psychrobacter celer TaxID=306572 RepID=UPI003FD00968
MSTRNCHECHTPLTGKRTKFCSDICHYEHTYYTTQGKKRKQQHTNCLQCDSDLTEGQIRFCNSNCNSNYNNHQRLVNAPEGEVKEHSTLGCYQQKHEGKWVLQHRIIMEKVLGRKLTRAEKVRHINGDRKDNRIENLEVYTGVYRTKENPHGIRVIDKVANMLSLLKPDELTTIEALIRELRNKPLYLN